MRLKEVENKILEVSSEKLLDAFLDSYLTMSQSGVKHSEAVAIIEDSFSVLVVGQYIQEITKWLLMNF